MSTVVFDDNGAAWDLLALEHRMSFDSKFASLNFIQYLTDERGFVALTKMQRSAAARLRLRPLIVAPAGLAAVLFALTDEPPRRIVLSHPSDGCGDELFADLRKLVERLAELVSFPPEPDERLPFLREERPLAALVDELTPLSSLFRMWAESGRRLDDAAAMARLDEMVKGRFIIVDAKDDKLLVAKMGKGFLAFDSRWREAACGLPVEHQPDYAYGCWARDIFREALSRDQPLFDNVDAIIRRPHLGDEIRARYRMIVLPFARGGSPQQRLLCASVVDHGIDLRRPRPPRSDAALQMRFDAGTKR